MLRPGFPTAAPMQDCNRSDPGPWGVIAFAALAAAWFASPWFPLSWLTRITAPSDGWIGVTLVASAFFGLGQLAIAIGPGRASLAAIGWRWREVMPALLGGGVLWGAMQAGTLLAASVDATPLVAAAEWERGAGHALGPLLAQLLGTALFEESMFRGYLWPALSRRLCRLRWPRLAGALASQSLFALLHLPMLLARGDGIAQIAATLLALWLTGLVFVLVYASTRNLFVAVAIHALGNAPTPLFEPQGMPPTMILLAGTLLLCAAAAGIRRIRATRIDGGGGFPGAYAEPCLDCGK